jgi:hypothetical protein
MGAPKAVRAVNRIDAVSFLRNDKMEAAYRIAREAVPNLSLPLSPRSRTSALWTCPGKVEGS